MKLPVVITVGEDGYFVAEIPVLPGCISQGKTREDALANIKEAAELCLESMDEEGWTLPGEYTLDQVEVGAWIWSSIASLFVKPCRRIKTAIALMQYTNQTLPISWSVYTAAQSDALVNLPR